MKHSSLLRSFLTLSAFAALAFWPQAALAQHGGGHGVGGGFHGGGGGFHGGGASFHGGGNFSGHSGSVYGGYRGGSRYHGGGYSGGYHGGSGYYGRGYGHGHGWYGRGWYGGRYWGYPYYGWGWGWGFGWGYPYGYWGYPTYYYSYPTDPSSGDPNTDPNAYPFQCPPGYSCIQDQRGNPPQDDPPADDPPANGSRRPAPSAYPYGNPRPWREPSTPSPQQAPAPSNPNNGDLPPSTVSHDMTPGRVMSVDRIAPEAIVATPAVYRTVPSGKPVYGPVRPEVVRAMQHLHEMPPYAREREISTGRYSQFSDEEKQLLCSVR